MDLTTAQKMAVEFSAGSDARLRGDRLAANPHDREKQSNAWMYWRLGWIDVHLYWGLWVKQGQLIQVLPPVPEDVA